ncbi:BREX-1 system adenine-specific DNA-methyltransferase PglX [Clostridium estertheticum]|uniref:Eco57I restriction-modification methylase domain-containing protein n=1 Tax=Clostridium estertheticum TaxID=238834 RepID=UPI0013E9162E|nr:DNA methyltransferase [Clostridium estertheticum]MBZ9688461.1 BREX-1 system adenine-specific DNA-methyltransferase PglX [Clostridium estertheticum]
MSYFNNHFLFSETYIKEYIKEQSTGKSVDKENIEIAFKQIKQWNDEYVLGDYSDEPWADYIDSVLDVLGFQKNKENSSRLLYVDTIKEAEIPVAICNLIDKKEAVDTTTKGKYHAFKAIKVAKAHDANWAMLTNGYKWRIYNINNVSPYENYLEIDLEESIKNNNQADEAFKLFYLFFNVHTYCEKDGQLIIENIKDLSAKKAEIIEKTLRGKAEEILKELCYGLKEDMVKETYTELEKKAIYNDAIILLYRLLFFGYAESRGLLPVVKNDPDYTDSYKKLCDDAIKIYNAGDVYKIKDGYDFWNRLDNQLRIYVDRSYNGGLFHNEDKLILNKHRIANGRLTKCLAEISYNFDKNGKYSEIIEYKDLSVRNLGSIYEGLLEYRLFIAEERMIQRKNKGKVNYLKESEVKLQNSDLKYILEEGSIYLSQDALERKETGAYYTPEDVVEYIVENTVGKKLEELKKELFENRRILLEQLSYEPVESNKRVLQMQIDEITLNFINEKILTLSIIDSAMGSGHFLVNAAYKVANEIVNIIAENDWESNDDDIKNVDIKQWKRKVVENCIYGIDINGLSVALAKLSLWLISASNDRALSFLDHHLKEGDSIIGTDRSHVEVKDEKYPLFEVSYEHYMRPILRQYKKLNDIGSATKANVGRQNEIYDQIKNDLKIAKKKYDYYLANQYLGGIKNENTYGNLLRSNVIDDFKKQNMDKLWELAKDKNFFHWELEFPEVFQKGGFDIGIGNPPYVQSTDSSFKYSIFKTLKSNNLFSYMIENHLKNLIDNGKYGFIIPISAISGLKFNSLQELITDTSSEVYIDSFAKRPCKIFNKVEQRLAIIYGNKKSDIRKCKVYTSGHKRWYWYERKKLFKCNLYTECKYFKLRKGTIAKVSSNIENSIIEKIFINNKSKKIKDYYEGKKENSSKFLVFHSTSGYWLKALDYMPDFYSERKGNVASTKYKYILFEEFIEPSVFISLFNSSLFYWYWILFSDERDLTKREIDEFPINYESIDNESISKLKRLCTELMISYKQNSMEKTVNLGEKVGIVKFKEFHPKYSKKIIDKIDDLIGHIYGLCNEEIEFIKNYDVRFRMGEESTEEDE